MTMYEQSQQSDWLQTELESMSSQADSPAKISQSQETKQAYKTEPEVGYGQSAPVLLGSFDPETLSAQAGGALNPTWVEWLMGFPLGHTDLNA